MGNSNRRTSRSSESIISGLSPSVIAVDWKNEAYINKLILEKKLAPRTSTSVGSRDTECPICFVDYEQLNDVVCCRQAMCTDCAVALKKSATIAAPAACPFCGEKSLVISFIPKRRALPDSSGSTQASTAESSSKQSSSPGTATVKPTYTTPEQERRLRSLSSDGSSISMSASKAAREALERQISNQRKHFYEEDEQEQALLQESFVYSGMRRQQHQQAAHARAVSHSSGRSALRMNPYRYNNSARNNATDSAADAVRRNRGEQEALISTLQGLLGGGSMGAAGSIEELEELMFMEALRQSAAESAAQTASMPPAPPSAEPAAASTSTATRINTAISESSSGKVHADSDGSESEHGDEQRGSSSLSDARLSGELYGDDEEEADSEGDMDEELRLALQMSLLTSTAEQLSVKALPSPAVTVPTAISSSSSSEGQSSSASRATAVTHELDPSLAQQCVVAHRIQEELGSVSPLGRVRESTPPSSPQRLIDLIEQALSSPAGGSSVTDHTGGDA